MAEIIDLGPSLKVIRDIDNINTYEKEDANGNQILFAHVENDVFILTYNGEQVERLHYTENPSNLPVVTNPVANSMDELMVAVIGIIGIVTAAGTAATQPEVDAEILGNKFVSPLTLGGWLTSKDTGDLAEGSNLYYTAARVNTEVFQDSNFVDGTTINFTATPGVSITAEVIPGAIDHDALLNYSAAEHVDWASPGAGTIHTDNYIEGGPGTDTTAIHDDTAAEIFAITEKAAPVIGDWALIEDSEAGNVKKRVQLGNWPTVAAAETVIIPIRNSTAFTIAKGTPVYITGFHIPTDSAEVAPCDADVVGQMPAIGLAQTDILSGTNGSVITDGHLVNIDTSAFNVGDELYVSATPGVTLGLTNVKPTGAALIQAVATVLRSNISNGELQVHVIGRANDIPNIPSANFWLGNASGVAEAQTMSGDATMDNAGVVTIDKTGDWTGTFDGQEGTYYLSRANHTGTQLASTISDFNSAAESAIFTAANFVDGTTIDFTVTAGASVTAEVIVGAIDHDSLLNFVANEHIDHTSVTLTAGVGLTGGGDISANRTFTLAVDELAEKTGPLVGTDRLTGTSGTNNFSETISGIPLSIFNNDAGFISSTAGDWTGTFDGQEGTYYLDRANHTGTQLASTISDFTTASETAIFTAANFVDSTTINFTVTAGVSVTAATIDSAIDHDALLNYVAAEHIDWSVTGAQTIHADRITAAVVTQHEGSINHDNLLGFVANEHIDWTADQGATNINNANIELAVNDLTDAFNSTPADRHVLVYDGVTDNRYENRLLVEADISDLQSYLLNVVDDTTPQLGGNLDVNGNKIVSTGGANIDIEPNGTGNVLLGNMVFDADQAIGAGQDNYVLTYDNVAGTISLEPSAGGGANSFETWTIDNTDTEYTWAGTDGSIVADNSTDTVTLVAGNNITLDRDATLDAIRITATGGGSSRITSSVQTTNATPTELEKINDLTADSMHFIEVIITAIKNDGTEYGVWGRRLAVQDNGGTVTIHKVFSTEDNTSTGLNANSVTFTVNAGDIDIDVIGIAATTINWNSSYEIITKSSE